MTDNDTRGGVIVCGIDGSSGSRRALEEAIRTAARRGDRVRAVAVYEPPEMWAAWGYGAASGVALPDPDAAQVARAVAEGLDGTSGSASVSASPWWSTRTCWRGSTGSPSWHRCTNHRHRAIHDGDDHLAPTGRAGPGDRRTDLAGREVADLRVEQGAGHARGDADGPAVDGQGDTADPALVTAHEPQVLHEGAEVLPAGERRGRAGRARVARCGLRARCPPRSR